LTYLPTASVLFNCGKQVAKFLLEGDLVVLGEPFPQRASHPRLWNWHCWASGNIWSAVGRVFYRH